MHERDQDIIALTHVCRTWREVFVSRSSLWTSFYCLDKEKTRIYLERSKSSPIDLALVRNQDMPPDDPFFQLTPHATGRLRSLSFGGLSEDIQVVTSHLSHPAPLLERLSIRHRGRMLHNPPVLASTLFNGDFSSLRMLRLEAIYTELPWRNMVNLTSFGLHSMPEAISVGRLLDFFESAPHLEEVTLYSTIPTVGAQNGRVVSLACLKSMCVDDDNPTSVLLDHLLIPVGAKLEIRANLLSSLIGVHLPRSLDNLENFSDFTTIQLHPDRYYLHINFGGSNGQVNMTLRTYGDNPTNLTLGSLSEFDTSKTEQLEIYHGHLLTEDPLYQTLLPMKDLRTLMLSGCKNQDIFIRALQPTTSSSEVVVCPKLEEFILILLFEGMFDTTSVVEMAAARASRGKRLRTIRIIDGRGGVDLDVSELRKYVWNVEYSSGAGL